MLDIGRIFVVLLALTLVAALIAGSVFVWGRVTSSPAEQASSNLSEIVTLHARANASPDLATRYSLLVEAETAAVRALESAPADQADSIVAEHRAIQEDLDRLTRMVRIEAIQPVGGIPEAASLALPALFDGGGRTYLLADALYEVDIATNQLVELLRPGETVAGEIVGPLLAGTWRGDGPIVVDSERSYIFDPVRGQWDWEALGDLEGEPVTGEVLSAGVFDLNLYLVDGENGRIMKFSGGDYESAPEDWAPGVAPEELKQASDIIIDGNIYVLQPDGSILKFFLNKLAALIKPEIQPPFDSASALVDAGSGYYIVNASDGRIARISEDGTLIQQFSPRNAEVALGHLKDAIIDESTGIALLLTGEALYTTRLVPSQE
ncbi:hypothetical protein BH23CHL2_BH23CHL2_06130 [soil metagenome]